MQYFSPSRRVSATHEQDAQAGCPGRVKAARVSLNPGALPGARPGCPARMPGSCVAGFTRLLWTIVLKTLLYEHTDSAYL